MNYKALKSQLLKTRSILLYYDIKKVVRHEAYRSGTSDMSNIGTRQAWVYIHIWTIMTPSGEHCIGSGIRKICCGATLVLGIFHGYIFGRGLLLLDLFAAYTLELR